jgi:hypothetical protein
MSDPARWDRCVSLRGTDVSEFAARYLGAADRRVVLIGGAGFDPRSTQIAQMLSRHVKAIKALFIREERPGVLHETLRKRADANADTIQKLVSQGEVATVSVFANDGAVIGGREVAKLLASRPWNEVTDVVVDLSALSKGVVFPLVRWLLESLDRLGLPTNIHLMVYEDASLDQRIVEVGCDRPSMMAGFEGTWGLDQSRDAAKLWLPQLIKRQHPILDRLHRFLAPNDVCPILPFPAENPRLPDELIEEYRDELMSTWSVEPRDIVYAHERDPLDLYRTILRIHAARQRVFEEVGGSITVLSPLGSKVLAVGALMAALDRNFPVAYVESIDYDVRPETIEVMEPQGEIVHVWLRGGAGAQ